MSLQEKIDQDLKQAMISRDETRLSTLRFLKSALKYSAIEKKTDSLSDADIQQLIQKQIKQRKESIDQFMKGNRKDLADKEVREAEILESYLPKQCPMPNSRLWCAPRLPQRVSVQKKISEK